MIAILSGVVFYAQSGLLFRPEPTLQGHATEHIYISESKPELENKQESSLQNKTEITKSTEHTEPKKQTTTSQKTSGPNPNICNTRASTIAKDKYEKALRNEHVAHKERQSRIKGLSKLLSPVHGNKSKQEQQRHQKAIERITTTYRQALERFGCEGAN